MTEHDYYQSMIREHAVDDAAVKAKARASSGTKQYVWRKAAAIAAVCAVLLIGTVLAIPSARAEVLKWFDNPDATAHRSDERISSYLAGNESERAEDPALATLVSTPDPDGDGAVTLPIDRTETNAVNSEAALAVSAFLHENCDVALGDAIYDGEEIYQSIRMNGLSGLWLLEKYVGSFETAVPVDPKAMTGIYSPDMLEDYLSGEKTLYEHPNGWILYEMPDGSRHGGRLELSDAIEDYLEALRKDGLIDAVRSEEQQRIIRERNRAYLSENGLVAVAQIMPYADDWSHYWEQFTDADGNMTVRVFYEVSVIEEDRAGGEFVSDTDLYSAELGTITIDMNAYRSLPQAALTETNASFVTWGPEPAVISRTAATGDDRDYHNEFTKYQISMEGVTMRLETKNAAINALGIRNIVIRVNVPDTWTEAERVALLNSLQFKLLINGESGGWITSIALNTEKDGSLAWTVLNVWDVPDEILSSIRTISLCPSIYRVDKWVEHAEYADDDRILSEVDPPFGETASLNLSKGVWCGEDTVIEYPQYTLTLDVN